MPKEDKIEIVSERNTVGLDLRNVQIAFDHIAIVHKKILARNFKCFIVKSWIFHILKDTQLGSRKKKKRLY